MSDESTATMLAAMGRIEYQVPEAHEKGKPIPQFDGLRMTAPGGGAVYLVMNGGYLHGIPNPGTYENLFRSWSGIVTDGIVVDMPHGPNISDGAILAQAYNGGAVYLVTNGHKHHVTSPTAMDRYQFAWNRIQHVAPELLNSIPTGFSISWPQ